ncbi:MAG TPA: flagellar basal-body MS-ring/collar protein FliF [Verrucomicrobiae bacterium]|nr:flagellar basal-body MS-ring/collar protein FliF [Verrucomicrobiae bacterium]
MNQNLRQLAQQLLQTWKQLGLNQRVSLVLGTGVVVAGLIGLSIWSSRPDFVLLYGKLDDTEASRVMAALDEAKIPYQTGRGGSSILVPADKVHQTRAQLAAKAIPRGEGVGFEIFDKPNFGISDFVQRANYLRAVQGELARTIAQIDLVDSARVMIVMPENRLLIDNQKKPTASVFVRVKSNGQLPVSAVNSIRFLVANAVEGLQANAVSVVDNLGNVLSENQDHDSTAGLSHHQLDARRNLEQYLARKAEGMLEKALGPGQAIVRVSADINWDTVSRTEEKFDPDGQVARSTTLNDETTLATTADANGGAAGVASNTANAETNSAGIGPLSNTQTKKKLTQNQYEINRSTSNTLLAAGGTKRLSAAVFVAQRMDGTGKARKPVPYSDEEMQKLKRVVQSALGILDNDPTRKDEITLEQMPFNDQVASELSQRLETDSKREFYWEIGKNVLYALVALTIFVVFLKLLKKTAAPEIPVGWAVGTESRVGLGGEGQPGGELDQWLKDPKPGVVTVEVLNALIKENPTNMTQAVRSWLSTNSTSN